MNGRYVNTSLGLNGLSQLCLPYNGIIEFKSSFSRSFKSVKQAIQYKRKMTVKVCAYKIALNIFNQIDKVVGLAIQYQININILRDE
jgi:hypothetical protein